jgi:hypothetical protein
MKLLIFISFVVVVYSDDDIIRNVEQTTISVNKNVNLLRQNDDSESSTVHFTEMACTGDNMEWLSCGPRCSATCGFQPRDARRDSRAVCSPSNESGCYAGCFCKSGYVRFNDRCVLPVNCPRKRLINVTNN